MIFPSDTYKRMTSSPGGMKFIHEVIARSIKLKNEGKEIVDCGLGESSHGLLAKVIEAGMEALKKDEFYYVRPTQGLVELRAEISRQISKEFQLSVDSENVIVTPGAELGIDLVFKSILNPGDEVVIFDPFFIPFATIAITYGARPVFVDTFENGFLPSLKLMKKKITKKTKIIILNSPNNPTGRVFNKKLVEEITFFAKERKIYLLSDETYCFFDFEKIFFSPFNIYPEGTIVVRSFSKQYSMMGYKVGYIVSSTKIANYIKALQIPGWAAPRISSLMALAALKSSNPQSVIENYESKRDNLYKGLNEFGLVDYLPEGAFYFYLKCPSGNSLNFALELADKGLLVIPAFSTKNTHVRLSYGAIEKEQIPKILDAIESVL